MPRRLSLALIALLGIVTLSSCAPQPSAPSDKVLVAASIAPLADFVRQVGGDRVEVELLVPPGASPHTYELRPSQLRMLSRAHLLVLNGVGLEYWSDKVVEASGNPDLLVVDTSVGLEILAAGEHEGHQAVGNPHVWLSPLNAIHQVERIRDALSQVDPDGAAVYGANAERYIAELRGLHAEFLRRSDAFSRRQIVTFHAAWEYFARDYGLEVAAVVETTPGREPSPADIAVVVETVKRIGARAIFAEPQFSPKAAEVIAAESGAQVLFLNPLGFPPDYSYLEMMRANFREIEQALK